MLVSVLAVVLFAGLSVRQLKRDVLPNIDIPVVIVIWNYPGLSADDMETSGGVHHRTRALDDGGRHRAPRVAVAGRHRHRTGLLRAGSRHRRRHRADQRGLQTRSCACCRRGSRRPNILQYNASNVQVAQLTIKSDSLTEQELFDYGLNFLRLRLFTIPGLSTPAPFGGRTRQIMVDLDPQKMQARGVSPQDVVNSLLANNVILPAGQARIGNTEYDVLLNSSPLEVTEFNTMPLKVVNGVTVLLGDVAHVHDGYAVQSNIVRVNGRRATYLAILRKAGASTLAVVDAVRERARRRRWRPRRRARSSRSTSISRSSCARRSPACCARR